MLMANVGKVPCFTDFLWLCLIQINKEQDDEAHTHTCTHFLWLILLPPNKLMCQFQYMHAALQTFPSCATVAKFDAGTL